MDKITGILSLCVQGDNLEIFGVDLNGNTHKIFGPIPEGIAGRVLKEAQALYKHWEERDILRDSVEEITRSFSITQTL